MQQPEPKPKRKVGRPKTLNREHALQVALNSYWSEGIHRMSLNEVCRRAKIAKPGLYREFGGEDGLMSTVLQAYVEQEMSQVKQLFDTELPAETVLSRFADRVMSNEGRIRGCLMAEMIMAVDQLGPETTQMLLQERRAFIAHIERWVQTMQERGALRAVTDARTMAKHIAAQNVFAALRVRRGAQPSVLRADLALSFAGYLHKPLYS